MAALYLIDGMSHIYRAYYAIQGLTSSSGIPSNAIYGFTVMLRKLIQEEKPDYLGVAIDLFGPTVRHEKYEAYKATRPQMPEDLVEQLPYIRQVCKAFGIPVLSHEKYEADDVIGTLARQAVAEGLEVVIVTIDKDMLQLVGDHVSVLDTRTQTRLDPHKVQEKWGVRPDQVVDMLSLVGDKSDNIPGAPGIGEKGAGSLLRTHGTLENLLENYALVERKTYRKSLQENVDQIMQSRELLRIHDDLPLKLDLQALRLSEPDQKLAYELFRELNFSSLVQEFLPAAALSAGVTVKTISKLEEFTALLPKFGGKQVAVSFWTEDETDGWPEGIALSHERGTAYFLSGDSVRRCGDAIATMFAGPTQWIFHDLKPWLLLGHRMGWELDGSFLDTMLMAYLLDPNKKDFSLKQIGLEFLNRCPESTQEQPSLIADEKPQHLADRAELTLQLSQRLYDQVEQQGLEKLLAEIEMPLVEVLARMESDGVKVDAPLLSQMSAEVGREIDNIAAEIYKLAGQEFNLNSPRQLSFVLFEKLGLPTLKKTGKAGHFSTGVDVLDELAGSYEIAQLILDYRELAKLQNTYLDALPKLVRAETGRIHTSYNQMVASTGRLSSSNPNLQNIPIRSETGRQVRRAFVAEEGYRILAADYSQIELRVMAHLSDDPVLVDAFRMGEDVHERTAREVFGTESGMDHRELRRRAKVINFGIMYGLSAFGLAKSLKIDRSAAQEFIDDYFGKYKGVKQWVDRTVREAEERGHVTTLFGRIRPIPEIGSKNWNVREFARRTAVNAPIQGTAADLIKMAMVAIHKRLRAEKLTSRIIMQVHDELVFESECSEIEYLQRLVKQEMEGVAELSVPLQIDMGIGESWYDAK